MLADQLIATLLKELLPNTGLLMQPAIRESGGMQKIDLEARAYQVSFVWCKEIAHGVIMRPLLPRAPLPEIEGVGHQRYGKRQPA